MYNFKNLVIDVRKQGKDIRLLWLTGILGHGFQFYPSGAALEGYLECGMGQRYKALQVVANALKPKRHDFRACFNDWYNTISSRMGD